MYKNDYLSIMIYIMIFLISFLVGYSIGTHMVQIQAVRNNKAIWTVDDAGNTSFEWMK